MTISELDETSVQSGVGSSPRRRRMFFVVVIATTLLLGMWVDFREVALTSSSSTIMKVDEKSRTTSEVINRVQSPSDLIEDENKVAAPQQEIQSPVSSSSPTPTTAERQERNKASSSFLPSSPTSAPSCHRSCRSRPNKIVLDHMGAAGLS